MKLWPSYDTTSRLGFGPLTEDTPGLKFRSTSDAAPGFW